MKKIMIYTKHESINLFKIVKNIKNNINIILMYIIFVCGIIISSSIILNINEISEFFESISVINCGITGRFFYYLCFSLIIVTVAYFLGLSTLGFPFLCLIPIICGLYFGSLFGVYINLYLHKGITAFLLLELPTTSIISTISLICACYSAEISTKLSTMIFQKLRIDISIKEYSIKYLFLILFSIIPAIISAGTFYLFRNIVI